MTDKQRISQKHSPVPCCTDKSKRNFIMVSTVAVSAVCAAFPFAAGITSVLDPVMKSVGNKKRFHGQKL